jgi:hypothetical protein
MCSANNAIVSTKKFRWVQHFCIDKIEKPTKLVVLLTQNRSSCLGERAIILNQGRQT